MGVDDGKSGYRKCIDVYCPRGRSETPIPSRMATTVEQLEQGFGSGIKGKLTEEGTSGTYFLRSKNQNLAVFKPIDEEQFAPNNPRGFKGKFG